MNRIYRRREGGPGDLKELSEKQGTQNLMSESEMKLFE